MKISVTKPAHEGQPKRIRFQFTPEECGKHQLFKGRRYSLKAVRDGFGLKVAIKDHPEGRAMSKHTSGNFDLVCDTESVGVPDVYFGATDSDILAYAGYISVAWPQPEKQKPYYPRRSYKRTGHLKGPREEKIAAELKQLKGKIRELVEEGRNIGMEIDAVVEISAKKSMTFDI